LKPQFALGISKIEILGFSDQGFRHCGFRFIMRRVSTPAFLSNRMFYEIPVYAKKKKIVLLIYKNKNIKNIVFTFFSHKKFSTFVNRQCCEAAICGCRRRENIPRFF
jgi:hypothetical protein